MAEARVDIGRPGMKQMAGPLLIVMILAMMVLPLPPIALDLLFTFNIAMSMLVLLIALYVFKPLDFSLFPNLHPAINIASPVPTRISIPIARETTSLAQQQPSSGTAGAVASARSQGIACLVFHRAT